MYFSQTNKLMSIRMIEIAKKITARMTAIKKAPGANETSSEMYPAPCNFSDFSKTYEKGDSGPKHGSEFCILLYKCHFFRKEKGSTYDKEIYEKSRKSQGPIRRV